MFKIACCLLLLLIVAFPATAFTAKDTISLSGVWQFAIDPEDKGIQESWYATALPDRITLPGSMAQRGKGDDITLTTQWTGSIYDSSFYFNPRLAKYRQPGNIKIPFWLTPAKHYTGAAWYGKEVTIPKTGRVNASRYTWKGPIFRPVSGLTVRKPASKTVL